jgi:hypothetical protein
LHGPYSPSHHQLQPTQAGSHNGILRDCTVFATLDGSNYRIPASIHSAARLTAANSSAADNQGIGYDAPNLNRILLKSLCCRIAFYGKPVPTLPRDAPGLI